MQKGDGRFTSREISKWLEFFKVVYENIDEAKSLSSYTALARVTGFEKKQGAGYLQSEPS